MDEAPPDLRPLTGVILAGGRARRMGGDDKGLLPVAGRPMVSLIVDALRPQVDGLFINANRNLDEYARLGNCPVITDVVGDYAGPLAGMLSALQAAVRGPVLTVPCDSPLLAPHLAARMREALLADHADIAVATDGVRMQPVFALLRCGLAASMQAFLERGERKIDRWYAEHRVAEVDFSDCPEMFLNVNTLADREALEAHLRATA